jgi:Zn-dependent M32 family carboxypeptidase
MGWDEKAGMSSGAIFDRATTVSCLASHIIDLFHRIHRWHQEFESELSHQQEGMDEEGIRRGRGDDSSKERIEKKRERSL